MKRPEYSIEEIAARMNANGKKTDLIRLTKALAIAEKCDTEFSARKKSAHALNTAYILAESDLDEATVLAGVLHHAQQSKTMQKEEIEKEFGQETAMLVEGADKLDEIEHKNRGKINSEIITKLILASAKDIRTIFIRLAARLDSLRYIESLPEQTQKEIAKATLDIYVPICHKLGMHKMRWELEDLAMKKLDLATYAKIKAEIKLTREEREKKIEEISKVLEETLKKKNLNCTVYGRAKNFYSIAKKMKQQNKKIPQIFDLLAFRIICNSIEECYQALSALQETLEQKQEEFNDYIANPKSNGYQSIHAVFFYNKEPIEAQFRTWDMHRNAEDGLAAHWQYKQYKKDKFFDRRLSIAKQLTEWQQNTGSKELMDSMKLKFEENKVFVFSPKNELIELEDGSTPIDFAFAVHSDLGLKCDRAKINGKIVSLDHKLENGDTVEIMTSEKQVPKQQWLSFVKTDKAKQKIRQALEIPFAQEKTKSSLVERIRKIFDVSNRMKQSARTAKCCSPLPGDEIIGIKTTKRKIIIHRADCENAKCIPENKKIFVSDALFEKGNYDVSIKIISDNRPGILPEILNAITAFNSTINETNAKLLPNNTMTSTINIKAKNLQSLEKLLERLAKIKGVKRAERA